jgi:hypothetical protein
MRLIRPKLLPLLLNLPLIILIRTQLNTTPLPLLLPPNR